MSYKRKTLRPSEIAKRGLITNSLNSKSYVSNYQYILSEIKTGRLKAREYGTKSRPYYTVSKAEIKRYQRNINN